MATINQQVDNVTGRIRKALDGFSRKDRKSILRRASRPVVAAARSTSAFSDSEKTHYRTTKSGARVAITPGNLRRSLDRVPGFRKSPSEFVGPRIGKRAKKTADGYYAKFLYGKRRKRSGNNGQLARKIFHQRVLVPAATKSRKSVASIVTTASRKAIVRWGKKYKVA